ncbi:MAG: carboxypeptidase-like regulatory domain-containing protein [Bacteroidetes bacterium]|nr:carboxypeptidase-like regulatory domain-containing protein [Bacteroidota bacterium]MBK7109235.1 carboxypeptidase-like regulatory domain-containing protein [Bacteroidota bacterium]MBK8681794.1 carboxypeptidase-like regulatory domain-containing protein [Bacteroidota bacterium]MBP7400123.1 carboxypeptidase-like regulatory domain-containing protein [Chitinophagales bacterium]
MLRNSFTAMLMIMFSALSFGQTSTATIYGTITDTNGVRKADVNVVILGKSGVGTNSNDEGYYLLEVEAGDTVVLAFSFTGYQIVYKKVFAEEGKTYKMNVRMKSELSLETVVITENRRNEMIMQIPIEEIEYIPDPTGDPIIALLKKYVTSNNELSSQYSVRGGNFDENLVYVNDFEIYRPLLIRSGQQEGLTFANYDLIQSVSFSAGGFEARFGDKLSSVLDIQYKKPKEFEAGVTASFLGGSFYINNGSPNKKMYSLFGARYKTTQYLLNSLSTQGEYNPEFFDVQGLLGFNLTEKSTLEILGNYSYNKYNFIPVSSETSTGVVNNILRLEVFFDGQEVDKYVTGFGGISYQYRPNQSTGYKLLLSGYRSLEDETFDIIGDYWLGVVETNPGDEDYNEIKYGLGSGTFQNFARNYLDVNVSNLGLEAYAEKGAHYIRYGGRVQYEFVNDVLKEWEMVDSAGYSLPYTGEQVLVKEYFSSNINLQSMRYNAFVQDTWSPEFNPNIFFTAGVRSQYWDVNKELTISPRAQMAWKPVWNKTDTSFYDIVIKAAVGLYHQPPFYRELRNLDGVINEDVLSQKSIHILIGADYNFKAWDRDFKFITELYYKYLYDLNPYDLENVRIRYYGENMATGYSAGVDFRLFGEIVEDADSWISLSLMQSRENIDGDSTFTDNGELEARGYIPRPTDQFFNFGMFFQDYIPGNKNFKVHLNFLYGSGLPFGPPDNPYYRNSFRIPAYRRVDIGFSVLLLDKNRQRGDKMWNHINNLWAGIEVFNLLGVSNTISYVWVKDINDVQYAFPNYLTDRRVNLKIIMKI